MEEFLRAGMEVDLTDRRMIDVQHIFYSMEPRTLSAAYKFYCQKELVNAHSAEADIQATIDVLYAQLARYQNLGDTVDSILGTIGEEKIIDYPPGSAMMTAAWRCSILASTKDVRSSTFLNRNLSITTG